VSNRLGIDFIDLLTIFRMESRVETFRFGCCSLAA
jgi:hypothetical protein